MRYMRNSGVDAHLFLFSDEGYSEKNLSRILMALDIMYQTTHNIIPSGILGKLINGVNHSQIARSKWNGSNFRSSRQIKT